MATQSLYTIDLKQYNRNIAHTKDVMTSLKRTQTYENTFIYHCHLNCDAELSFHLNNQDEITPNRGKFEHHGLRNKNTFVGNDTIFYNATNKT